MRLQLTVVFITLTHVCCAQSFSQLDFSSKNDYSKYETEIRNMADFLLSTPIDDKSSNAKTAFQNVFKWMQGTPDYSFQLDESITDISKNNEDVLVPLFAAMTSYVLHNKSNASNPADVKLNSFDLFLKYCGESSHNVKVTKELKKAMAAREKGELQKYLKL